MFRVLKKFHLQHKLKENWTEDESKLLEKLIFVEEENMQGSKKDTSAMKERQEQLMSQINEERTSMKGLREEKSDGTK